MTGTTRDHAAGLSSYVPRLVLRQLAAAPAAPPAPERFPAAIMLVDITGFTPMTAAALARGPAGVERLSRSFNSYLGRIIDLVTEHGGDVLKFVGDALMVAWPAAAGDLAAATRSAVGCGLAVARDLAEVEMESGMRLSLKVGVCAGDVVTTHVGGMNGEWLFLVAGPAVAQLSDLGSHLHTGDVVVSPDAWAAVSDRFVGQPLGDGHVRVRRSGGDVRLDGTLPEAGGHDGTAAALRGYVPRVLLSRIDAGQSDWLAELRRTTVIFANVRGLANETPDALAEVGRLTEQAQRILSRYDGWLKEITMDDKGTTLIGVFGVPPVTHENDPARAIDAALEIQARLRGLGLAAGVGVATGSTFCGPVGNDRRRDFAMLGGHLNLAARLMQAAPDDGVLCDAATAEAATPGHDFERLPAYVLKGHDEPIDVYRAGGRPVAAGEASPMVDRTTEMQAAAETLASLSGGTGSLVTLEGEPGIGKSRVAEEWLRRAQQAGVNVLRGSASDLDASTPYSAWRGVFEGLLGIATVPEPGARRAQVLEALAVDADNAPLAPLLGPVLSLDIADTEVTSQMSGAVRADNTGDLLVRLLRAQAERAPTMVLLEDVHWLDSASWSLVVRARREIPKLLLVLTRRPVADVETDPAAALRANSTTLRLAALSREDAVALAALRTGAAGLAEPVARVVHERAEGNPLFIEQLTYALRDGGQVVVDRGVLRSASARDEIEARIIPDTVQRVITTRLDQLPPGPALTIKVASVIGERFPVRTLAHIYPIPVEPAALMDQLDVLFRLDLLAPARSAPEPSYEFRHKIAQEVAYNLMPSSQSRQLHRALAEWHERTYAMDLSPFHSFLAHHWRRAGVAERAIDHLELAAAQALRTFANEEAISFLEEALALAGEAAPVEPARRARWHLGLGDAFVNLSRYRDGREQLELGLRLLGRAAPSGNWPLGGALVGQIARQGAHRIGLGRGGARLSDAQREDLVTICRAYERLAEATYYGGETLLPLYASIRILNDAEASGSDPEIARGLAGTGALFGFVPMPRVAESYLRRALARLERVDDLTTHEIVRIVAGFYDIGAGRWDAAREELGEVRRIAHRLGDRRRLLDALTNLAEIEYLRGSFAEAAALAEEQIAHARTRNDRRFEAEGLAVAAYCAWQRGRDDDAQRLIDVLNAMVAAEPTLHQELRIKHQGLLALMHLARGDRARALIASEELLRLTAGLRPTYFATYLGYVAPAEVYLRLLDGAQPPADGAARAAEALARLGRYASVFPIGRPRRLTLAGWQSWAIGKRAAAIGSWRRAVAAATQLSMPYEQGVALMELARHLDPTDPDRQRDLDAARRIFTQLGAARMLGELDRAAIGPVEGRT